MILACDFMLSVDDDEEDADDEDDCSLLLVSVLIGLGVDMEIVGGRAEDVDAVLLNFVDEDDNDDLS